MVVMQQNAADNSSVVNASCEPLVLDVRPIFARDGSPCSTIDEAVASLSPGQVFVLVAPFEPAPLFAKLRAKDSAINPRRWPMAVGELNSLPLAFHKVPGRPSPALARATDASPVGLPGGFLPRYRGKNPGCHRRRHANAKAQPGGYRTCTNTAASPGKEADLVVGGAEAQPSRDLVNPQVICLRTGGRKRFGGCSRGESRRAEREQ